MLKIEALPAFTDNYIWLLQDTARKRCAAVDPGDAGPVQRWLSAHPDWQLSDILVTHHHADHVGGVLQLKQACGATVYGPAHEDIPGRDVALLDNQRIQILDHALQVIEVPGHTLGHIAYFHGEGDAPWLLCGDTLFAGGCGRIFEGSPAQMFHSLQRLAALPAETQIYCTHEYTLSNLRFAQAVEPGNPQIAKRLQQVTELRDQNRTTLPSTLALEHATNPFLRSAVTAVAAAASHHSGQPLSTPLEVFRVIRAWKDSF